MRKWLCLLVLIGLPLFAGADDTPWTEPGADGVEVHLYLFWSQTCPHCLEARPRLLDLAQRHGWVRLHDYELSGSRENVERFNELAAQVGGEARAVPTLIYCGRMEVGLDSSDAGMASFLGRLEACRTEQGAVTDPGATVLRLPLIGQLDTNGLSLPLLTVMIAGMDAFNPCAFFVLLFLLSLLVHQSNRRRMALIGGVFVAFSGLMYFAFMAAWLNLFLVVGSLPWVTGAAGLLALLMGAVNVKDFVRFRQGISLSISDGCKATIFQRARDLQAADSLPAMLAATVVLAVSANFYELLCTAGFPMVFTRLLTLQGGGAALPLPRAVQRDLCAAPAGDRDRLRAHDGHAQAQRTRGAFAQAAIGPDDARPRCAVVAGAGKAGKHRRSIRDSADLNRPDLGRCAAAGSVSASLLQGGHRCCRRCFSCPCAPSAHRWPTAQDAVAELACRCGLIQILKRPTLSLRSRDRPTNKSERRRASSEAWWVCSMPCAISSTRCAISVLTADCSRSESTMVSIAALARDDVSSA